MKLYRIKDWDEVYENHETRKLDNLRWIPSPNQHDGLGFRRMASQPDAADLLAAWTLIVQVSSKGPRRKRGSLERDNLPLTPGDLGMMTGFPEKIFIRAFAFFSDPKQAWLVFDEQEQTEQMPLIPDVAVESPGGYRQPTEIGKGREGKGRESREPRASAIPDDLWVETLKANEAYQGIDVPNQIAKCRMWCETNGASFSRRRIVNWLNKCERRIVLPTNLQTSRQAPDRPIMR